MSHMSVKHLNLNFFQVIFETFFYYDRDRNKPYAFHNFRGAQVLSGENTINVIHVQV